MPFDNIADAVKPLLNNVLVTYTDYAGQEDTPFAVVTEPSEQRQYYSPGSTTGTWSYSPGQLQVDIYAADREQARTLGRQVAAALLDASISLGDGGRVDALRLQSEGFVPLADTGITTPAIFHRLLVFSYWVQRSS